MEQAFMDDAVRAALEGVRRREGGPFGAVVVRGGQVVARAWNRVVACVDPTAHAEVNAIREACRLLGRFHLEDCDLYTSCEPCPMCLGAIYWARLRSVYYAATRAQAEEAGFSDAFIYEELSKSVGSRSVRFVKVDEAAAAQAMREWAADSARIPY